MHYNEVAIAKSKLPIADSRLILRLADSSELAYLWEWACQEDINRLTCRPVPDRTKDEIVANYAAQIESDKSILLGIYAKEMATLLGRITLFDFNPKNQSMEMGFFLLPAFRKKGIMGDGIKLLLRLLFANNLMNKVYAQTASFNQASCNALEKAGFHCDGRLRQHHEWNGHLYDDLLYSILRQDWKWE